MILADTSVWVDHLRDTDASLAAELTAGNVCTHACVIGEIALGSLRKRDVIISALQDLPRLPAASDDEVLALTGTRRLFGKGIGYVDAHLIASVLLSAGTVLWTRDRRLRNVATDLAIGCPLT